MSTAEAVSVYYQSAMDIYYYEDGSVTPEKLVPNIKGAVLKENKEDLVKLKNYFNTVVKLRAEKEGGLWKNYYEARKRLN